MLRSVLFALTATAVIATPGAYADPIKEQFVLENGQRVLDSLNDTTLTAEERTEKFGEYMQQFTDMQEVARFVLGKYARRFSQEELATHTTAFKRYALAVYEVQLDRYRGEEIRVIGSTDRTPDDAVVETVIRRKDGRDMTVLWRVMKREGELQVMDVALDLDGNVVWLATQQRAQLIALLDDPKVNGRAQAVIDKLNSMTAKLESEKRAEVQTSGRQG